MTPLTEDRADELLVGCFGDSSFNYLWESITDAEWSGNRPVAEFLSEESYEVVFDPHGQNMAACLSAARYFGRDDDPIGYHLTQAELLDMSRQDWVANADFYVFSRAGTLCAHRTHEDPDSQYGFWIPTKDA